MSKNKINSRLDEFFSGLNSDFEVIGQPSDGLIPEGFAWETDVNGVYISCGDGVEQVLGFLPNDVVGNPLISFQLGFEGQGLLLKSLNQAKFPIEIELECQTKQSQSCKVRFIIFQKMDDSNVPSGFSGYCEKLIPENETRSGRTKTKPKASSRKKITSKKQPNEIKVETSKLKPVTRELSSSDLNTSPLVVVDTDASDQTGITDANKNKKSTKNLPSGRGTTTKFKPSKTSPLNESTRVDTEPISNFAVPSSTRDLSGVSLVKNKFEISTSVWTAQAQASFDENRPVAIPSIKGSPAILAVPLNLRNEKKGIIEIIDDKPNRVWSEEDKLILQEISHQLGLALENTQLYSTIQRELSERVKAERQTLRRNKDLANLNEIGQQLNRLVRKDQIFETSTEMTQKIMGIDNLLLSTVNKENTQFSFPVCLVNGMKKNLAPRKLSMGYQETVLETRKPLLINRDIHKVLSESTIDHSTYLPNSLLAVPLIVGDRSMGVLSVFDYQNENAFDEIQVELLSSVAAQVATALENSNLFSEISDALELIESRQKLQSTITEIVAALSQKGSEDVQYILKSLSQVTSCERVYYAESQESTDGDLFWHCVAAYTNPESEIEFNNAIIDPIFFKEFSSWASHIHSDTWYVCDLNNATSAEKNYLEIQNIKSLLLLAVKNEDKPTGFIALESYAVQKDWKPEEIDILRTASEAFANTLIRENLVNQLRTSLSETENLYSASHRLTLANNMEKMIMAVVSSSSESMINRGEIILFDYNLEGAISRMAVASSFSSQETSSPSGVGSEYSVSLFEKVYTSREPVYYDFILDSELLQEVKEHFSRLDVQSMAVLPLCSGNVQIGVLLLQTCGAYHFSNLEVRTYPALVDQMATAIQNLRLLESTQTALSETELLYKISSGITKSANMEELVDLVGNNVLPEGFDSLSLYVATDNTLVNSIDYVIVGAFSEQENPPAISQRISAEVLPALRFPMTEPVVLENIPSLEMPQSSHAFYKNAGITSAILVPLQTATNPVGFLLAGSGSACAIDPQEAHTLQIIGNSIAVAIERQRLLYEAQRRAVELQTAAEIARDTTSTLSQELLLSRIVNLLKDRFGFYHCSIFLVDESNKYAVVEESTGEAGKLMKQNKHKLAVGSKSVIGTCIASGQVVIVNDTSLSPVYLPNPLLLETRSEMGLPLKIGGRIIGALDLQSKSSNAFSENETTVLKILSDQISVAIENARAFSLSQLAVQEMRELDRVKSQFLANMSHELRTPLNSVIGFSRVILKGIDGPINKVQEQDITSIYNSGMNLLNMINEILDVSKIEAGKMELQLEEISLVDVIKKAIQTATGLIKDKPVDLIQYIPSDLPTVKGDQIKLGQVILNLLSNAIKFTEKGSVTIEAALTKDSNLNSEIRVTVSDSGIGIAAEDQPKLFQRFSQVDDSPTRKTGGTGLGLAISKSFIELHGGKIGLQRSEPGKGSVFFFTLPVAHTLRGLDINQLSHGENVILSIDDDPQVIALYERYLKNYGFEVVGLTNPAKALERAVELKPFAITLDIMMPQVDGWQVLHELRQDERTRDIPILVCSILEEEEKGFNLGASEYLVKPFLQGDLINAIHRINRDGASLEVLVIDDDEDDLKFVKKMVEGEPSFHPILAQGGKSALEILNNLTPDLIILDLFMPDMNGFELLDRFKSEPRLAKIPVIVLTGADLTPDQKTQLAESSKTLSTHGLIKESDILKNMEEALQRIKPNSTQG